MFTVMLVINVIAVGLLGTAGFVMWKVTRNLQDQTRTCSVTLEKMRSDWNRMAESVASVSSRMSALESRFEKVESYAGTFVPPKPARSGMNMSTNAEVMRLYRDGLDEFAIASELHVPVGEVRLLIHLSKQIAGPPVARRSSVGTRS